MGLLVSNYTNIDDRCEHVDSFYKSLSDCPVTQIVQTAQISRNDFPNVLDYVAGARICQLIACLGLLLYIYSILAMFTFLDVKKNYPLDRNMTISGIRSSRW